MTILKDPRQEKKEEKTETTTKKTKEKLMPPTKFDLSQVQINQPIQAENQVQTSNLIEEPVMKPINQQNQPETEAAKTTPLEEPVQEENSIEAIIQYTKSLAQHLSQKKVDYAAYSIVFDQENRFYNQLLSIQQALSSGDNIPALNGTLLQIDFAMTEHEIILLKSLIEFLQTKLSIPNTENKKFIDLRQDIETIQETFKSFHGKAIDQTLIEQHKKCVAAISTLNEKIKHTFSEFKSVRNDTITNITAVETAINTQYDALDDTIKPQIDKNSFINALTIKKTELNSPEVSFYTIIEKLKHLLDQFEEKKNEAIKQHASIPSVELERQAVSTVQEPIVNHANLTKALSVVEEKTQAIRSKQQNLSYGFFTSLFFSHVSQQKQRALDEILQAQDTVFANIKPLIQNTDNTVQEKQAENLKSALTKLYASIDQNMATLSQYRGFRPHGKTTSDKIALELRVGAQDLEKIIPSMLTK